MCAVLDEGVDRLVVPLRWRLFGLTGTGRDGYIHTGCINDSDREWRDMTDEKTGAGEDLGLIEKAFLMGVGAAMLAKDKVEELADELVQRGKLTSEQSDTFVNRLVTQAESTSKSVENTVTREVERAVSGMGLASAKDLEEVRAELTEIKALIASLRPAGGSEQS